MTFRKLSPQIIISSDGYVVQTGSRSTMEYVEGSKKAIIQVEIGVSSTCLYVNRINGWLINDTVHPITDVDKRLVIERISAALRFDGRSVEYSDYQSKGL